MLASLLALAVAAKRWLRQPTSVQLGYAGDSRLIYTVALVAVYRVLVKWARRRVENPQLTEEETEQLSSVPAPIRSDLCARPFDYIVVGAGSAGCVLAAELSARAGKRVLLIEAGPPAQGSKAVRTPNRWTTLWHSEVDWGYSSEPQDALQPPGRRLELERGKVLGGSSSINAMMHVRGAREDFDRWADEYGCQGWGYRDVLPHFKALENCSQLPTPVDPEFRGFAGPIGLSAPANEMEEVVAWGRAAKRCGIPPQPDYNGEAMDGFGPTQQAVAGGQRQDAYTCFVEPVLAERPNLTVLPNALVEKVLLSSSSPSSSSPSSGSAEPRATGVRLRLSGAAAPVDVLVTPGSGEVILSAGALNTPQLLMLSGIGDRSQLEPLGIPVRRHLPAVGRNLHDHPAVNVMVKLKQPLFPRPDSCNLHATAFIRTKEGTPGPNVQLVTVSRAPADTLPRMAVLLASARFAWIKEPLLRPLHSLLVTAAQMAARPMGADFSKLFAVAVILNQPRARGWVRLASADPTDAPRVNPNLLGHPDDVRDLLEGLKTARRVCSEPGFAELVEEEVVPGPRFGSGGDKELKDFLRRFTASVWHYCGTARMGPRETEETVVDTDLRVFGVRGLRVADASVWPFVVTGNTNAASMMVGHRCASLIASATVGPSASRL